eukprot:TRINITY_DN31237_c0_g1_i2.p1 TRINITY_DN31237_c0_g1~~TRINITY_DN31237_c0_g1_i2.p1  ORF type:complete len:286 (-),score=19.23 TRINITY_DN31237_c0_g1_i2:42-791(-)
MVAITHSSRPVCVSVHVAEQFYVSVQVRVQNARREGCAALLCGFGARGAPQDASSQVYRDCESHRGSRGESLGIFYVKPASWVHSCAAPAASGTEAPKLKDSDGYTDELAQSNLPAQAPSRALKGTWETLPTSSGEALSVTGVPDQPLEPHVSMITSTVDTYITNAVIPMIEQLRALAPEVVEQGRQAVRAPILSEQCERAVDFCRPHLEELRQHARPTEVEWDSVVSYVFKTRITDVCTPILDNWLQL